jgi:ADP-ribose pyrophosphatase YjhB (NUDIX family)
MKKKAGEENYKQLDLKRGVDFIGITCVFYCHDGKGNLLMHKRSARCRDEVGRWDVGGGAMEFGETFEEAVCREIREEYATEVLDLKFLGAHNVLRENGEIKTHWIALIFTARVDPEEVRIGDPEKVEEIGWFDVYNPPSPTHSMVPSFLEMVKKEILQK